MAEVRNQRNHEDPKPADKGDKLSSEARDALQSLHPSSKHKSYLEAGINLVTSHLISDDKLRSEVNHYGCEFAKTATLFAAGKTGLIGTFFVYGLSQASPDAAKLTQAEDFLLGAAKGESIKGLFGLAGSTCQLTATRGILMGITSRGAEALFQRETFTNPGRSLGKLCDEVMNKEAWLTDALVFSAGETLGHAGQRLMPGSRLFSGMVMGGSFGMVNGASAECGRQRAAGEKLDLTKILERGALQGVLDAVAAGAGLKATEIGHQVKANEITSRIKTRLDNLHRLANIDRATADAPGSQPDPADVPSHSLVREFVITSGLEQLEQFRANKNDGALLRVRELQNAASGDELGPMKNLFVQRLRIGESNLLPAAADADLVASCFPENLPEGKRQKHVFPEGHGRVWIQTGEGGKLKVTGSWHPVSEYVHEGYSEPYRLDGGNTTISAMAPLVVGDPHNFESAESKAAWAELDHDLAEAKLLGLDAISTDVWWSLVEPRKGEFDWSYYEKLAEHIKKSGLKWTPILSFHQCGGNIGDTVNVPVPDWVWAELAAKARTGNPDALKYVSEQGHSSPEYISVWATELALDHYAEVMRQFQEHFAHFAPYIAEINVSLGPAGELRYPSYNSHDVGTGYPTRGALQCYSELAKDSFREAMLKKYNRDINAVAAAWGIPGLTVDKIHPPDDAAGFFARDDHLNTQYGRDLIDWYNQSLIDHGDRMMSLALKVFAANDAPFAGIDLGAKVPGVHWRVGERHGDKIVLGDRLAEVTAGLIRTSSGDWYKDEDGRGYRGLVSMFHKLQPAHPGTGTAVVPSFTALEMPDGQDGPSARSLPHTVAIWFGQEALRQELTARAENALEGNLKNPYDWDNMRSLLLLPGQTGYYQGLTVLRLHTAVNDPVARAKISEIIHAIKSSFTDNKKAS
jgi:hypothetical protein